MVKIRNSTIITWAIIIYLFLVFLIMFIPSVHADGIDHGKGFYGKDVIVKPDEIDVWVNHNGIWMKELPRVQLPNGHFMLSPKHRNYWRDFDEWPCYYPIWPNDGGKCINPGDEHRNYYVVELRKDKVRDVSEPKAVGLLGIGLLFMGFRSMVRGKL